MYDTKSKLLDLSTRVSKYCVGMEGNVSGKVDENSFLIKASGQSLSKLSGGGLVTFDFNGNQIDNPNKKGSMELSFHTYLLGFDGVNLSHIPTQQTHLKYYVVNIVLCLLPKDYSQTK